MGFLTEIMSKYKHIMFSQRETQRHRVSWSFCLVSTSCFILKSDFPLLPAPVSVQPNYSPHLCIYSLSPPFSCAEVFSFM